MPTVKEVVKHAIELHKNRDLDGAMRIYNEVLAQKIFDPFLCHATGTLFLDMGLLGVAIQMLTRCVETSPETAPWLSETYMNLGVALRNEAHEEEAAACYRRSLELQPNDATGWSNLSGVYVNYGMPEKVIEYADKALQINPSHAQAKHHRALALLEMGKYESGFRQYEARMEIPEFHLRKYAGDRWHGHRVDGTLVIHGEQGLGDEVMFCSLIERAKERCQRLVIECNHKLISLFERSFGVKCYPDETELMKHEKTQAWCPMGSLPYIFGIKSPITHEGYLKTDPELDKKYAKDGYRVGVSWRGGTKKTHGMIRNFSLKKWKTLVEPEWVSLQYGNSGADIEAMGIRDLGWTGNMDEFASLVKSCDLVVTICNTTVHFAGALNVPAIVMVPSKPAWRYGLTGERMLWYPSIKMVRQADGEDWSEVIKRVKDAIPRKT